MGREAYERRATRLRTASVVKGFSMLGTPVAARNSLIWVESVSPVMKAMRPRRAGWLARRAP